VLNAFGSIGIVITVFQSLVIYLTIALIYRRKEGDTYGSTELATNTKRTEVEPNPEIIRPAQH
jgi:hypothetical protein